jgi:hypothetical protein
MGHGDEYSRDAYTYEEVCDSDDSEDFDPYLHPEDWQDMYSHELLDAWECIQEYTYDNYLFLKNDCNYTKFVEFVLDPQKTGQNFSPTFHADKIWNKIKNIQVVHERVDPENFYAWINIYLWDD